VAVEYRWADGHYDRIPGLVEDLVSRDRVLTSKEYNRNAARGALRSVRSRRVRSEDGNTANGLVANLNRRGGNATGVTSLFGGMAAKQLGLLRDLVPTATVIGLLVNPGNAMTALSVTDALAAAQRLGIL
jgi:hypothetical protein